MGKWHCLYIISTIRVTLLSILQNRIKNLLLSNSVWSTPNIGLLTSLYQLSYLTSFVRASLCRCKRYFNINAIYLVIWLFSTLLVVLLTRVYIIVLLCYAIVVLATLMVIIQHDLGFCSKNQLTMYFILLLFPTSMCHEACRSFYWSANDIAWPCCNRDTMIYNFNSRKRLVIPFLVEAKR